MFTTQHLTALLTISCYLVSTITTAEAAASYALVKEYAGNTFFDQWNYFGNWDNLTLGDVNWLDQSDAVSQKLTFVNPAGNAIIKVDNTTNVPWNDKRNSIRLESKDSYGVGTVWIFDALHLPYGCSVWPSFWTKGVVDWPHTGEIDIIEYINAMATNQYALHTDAGCTATPDASQVGKSLVKDCNKEAGCTVQEAKTASNAEAFAAAGGGVYATQFDVSGIYIWFWSRPNVPKSISSATSTSSLDISDFGPPSASYPATSCDVSKYFTAQQLVLDITLCGKWANSPGVYAAGGKCTGKCYENNVVGDGKNYDTAYFEIPYIRAYSNVAIDPSVTASGTTAGSTPTSGSNSGSKTGSKTGSDTAKPNAASRLKAADGVLLGFLGVFGMMMHV